MRTPVETLTQPVYRASQVRDLDRLATERHGIPSYELMSRAAAEALRVLRAEWPTARAVIVYCGSGNNAGDGYVLARLAYEQGFAVRVLAVAAPDRLKGDALRAHAECAAARVAIETFDADAAPFEADVIVDALLGIGADRPLEGAFAAAVAAINSSGTPVLALDIPTGLDADSGWPLGSAVRAAVTVTFVGLKQGLYLGAGCDHSGRIEFADLGIPSEAQNHLAAPLERLGYEEIARALPRRPRSSHKGTSGRLLLVGGGPSMAGAIRLAAEAALRTGAGLVYVATHADSVAGVLAGRPEVIVRAADGPADLDELIGVVDAAVLGPGLGRSAWARALFARLIAADLPLIVDADGLNLLAETLQARGRWILTPHPGEASRLLGTSIGEVQRDRASAARELARRFGGTVILKGAGSLVATSDPAAPLGLCSRGNPGMATAGTGDVLAGVLGALAVQTRDLERSARAGVLLHALAGDSAAEDGERGMLAADLMPHLRRWANPF